MRSAAGIKHGLREAFVPLVSTNTLCKIRIEREDGIVMKAKKQTHRIGSATSKSTARSFSVQRILVPIDLSEPSKKALRYALTLARPFGAKLILLYVIEPVATHDFAYQVIYRWTSHYVHPTIGALESHLVQAGRDVFAVRSGRGRI